MTKNLILGLTVFAFSFLVATGFVSAQTSTPTSTPTVTSSPTSTPATTTTPTPTSSVPGAPNTGFGK